MSENQEQAVAKTSNVVAMKDGREVDFGARGKLKKSITATETGVRVSIDVINGDTHVLDFNLEHSLVRELLGYGISQKITDTVVKADDGDDISFGVERIMKQLQDGIWTARTQADSSVRGFADLVEAIRRIRSYAEGSEQHVALKANLAAKSEEELKVLKTNDTVKAVIAQIVAEKAAARAAKLGGATKAEDSADLLEGL